MTMNGKIDVKDLTKLARLSVQWFGVWPTNKNKILSKFLFSISTIFIFFSTFIPQTIHLIHVWGNINHMSQIISISQLPFLVVLTKMTVVFYNKKKIKILYDHMILNWEKKRTDDEIEIMMKNVNKGRRIGTICISLGSGCTIALVIQWLFDNIKNWKNLDQSKNFTLYLEAYYPFSFNYSPLFETICIIQIFSTIIAVTAYTGTDRLFCHFVLHFSAEYNILRLQLMYLVDKFNATKFDSKFDGQLSQLINIHDNINSSIAILESTFYLIFLIELITCSIQIFLQGYVLVLFVTDEKASSMLIAIIFIIIYLIFWIGNFCVYCYLGEQLQIESSAFSQTAYDCSWYQMPPKKAKCILLLIKIGHKPVGITAGKFCFLNLILFGSIIKTSLGYLSFLITMRQSSK